MVLFYTFFRVNKVKQTLYCQLCFGFVNTITKKTVIMTGLSVKESFVDI